jgi:transposase
VRHGTVSLLLKDRHRSREFVEFLKILDAAYPADIAIKLILDNHSAHISKETKAWLAAQPDGRFGFTFTPKHGSWLNLIEGFSKLARSALRHIRVASKQELKERIMTAIDNINRNPVVHTWSYMLSKAARYDSNLGNDRLADVRAIPWDCCKPLNVADDVRWSGEGAAGTRTG